MPNAPYSNRRALKKVINQTATKNEKLEFFERVIETSVHELEHVKEESYDFTHDPIFYKNICNQLENIIDTPFIDNIIDETNKFIKDNWLNLVDFSLEDFKKVFGYMQWT